MGVCYWETPEPNQPMVQIGETEAKERAGKLWKLLWESVWCLGPLSSLQTATSFLTCSHHLSPSCVWEKGVLGSLWELRESSPVRYIMVMIVVVTAEVTEEVTQSHNSLFGIQNPNLCNTFGWRVFAAFGGPLSM